MEKQTTKMMVGLVAVWAGLSLAACNNADTAQVAAGGEEASITNGTAVKSRSAESLSTVALYYPTGKTATSVANFCTGTLIAPDVVMTAGHCFADFAKDVQATPEELRQRVTIGFGLKVAKSSQDSDVEFRNIAAFKVNPKYVVGSVAHATKKPMYDVTLIRLDKSAPTSAKPAKMVTQQNVLRAGLTVTLVGFGLLDANPQKLATKMMEVDVQVDDPEITATQFTYKVENGKSSCSGDSGGPAYVKLSSGELAVVGITSWGDQTCTQIGAYTSVPAMYSWISQELNTL